MIVGCYVMDLYCDSGQGCRAHDQYGPRIGRLAVYTGHTEAECKRAARKAGWKFKGAQCFCPACIAAVTQG